MNKNLKMIIIGAFFIVFALALMWVMQFAIPLGIGQW